MDTLPNKRFNADRARGEVVSGCRRDRGSLRVKRDTSGGRRYGKYAAPDEGNFTRTNFPLIAPICRKTQKPPGFLGICVCT